MIVVEIFDKAGRLVNLIHAIDIPLPRLVRRKWFLEAVSVPEFDKVVLTEAEDTVPL